VCPASPTRSVAGAVSLVVRRASSAALGASSERTLAQPEGPYHEAASRRHPAKKPRRESRAELALSELCSKLGYCIPPDEQEAILANPPADEEAFVDAVLIAEGRDLNVVLRQERRPMLDIVTKWGVYDRANRAGASGNGVRS
jgi:hypothetical protein